MIIPILSKLRAARRAVYAFQEKAVDSSGTQIIYCLKKSGFWSPPATYTGDKSLFLEMLSEQALVIKDRLPPGTPAVEKESGRRISRTPIAYTDLKN
ncbi:MAG: hypothetical protein NT076_04010 [Candidatus Pacearchaeota archaeon]|nr:hypothetical protein [Candidatus Pacearchaeota archaeon]